MRPFFFQTEQVRKSILKNKKVSLRGRDNANFPVWVATAGRPDTLVNKVFEDIVNAACKAGRSTAASQTGNCATIRLEANGHAIVI